jgi:hypothetical protein
MVKALRYKPEGRGFETRCGELISSIYLMLPVKLGPGVYSAGSRKIMFLGSRARPVRRADNSSSAAGIATGYGLGDWGIGITFLAAPRHFSLPHRVQSSSRAHQAPNSPIGTWSSDRRACSIVPQPSALPRSLLIWKAFCDPILFVICTSTFSKLCKKTYTVACRRVLTSTPSCEYIQSAVVNSRQEMVLQLVCWGVRLKTLTHRKIIVATKCCTRPPGSTILERHSVELHNA